MNFVVVGGGPTGVEMAGALRELFAMVLKKDFPQLHEVVTPNVYLIEAVDYLLGAFHPSSRDHALAVLRERGVKVMLGESVVRVTADAVYLKSEKKIETETLIWTAGVQAASLAYRLGLPQERGGRITVDDVVDVIRDEADRIRALVDRMEVFDDKPIERRAVNIHRVLEHVRRLAQSGSRRTCASSRATIPRCRRCGATATSSSRCC